MVRNNHQLSLKLMSIEWVTPSSHLILCHPLLLLPLIPPSIRVFSNESTLHMRWQRTGVSALASFPPKNTQDKSKGNKSKSRQVNPHPTKIPVNSKVNKMKGNLLKGRKYLHTIYPKGVTIQNTQRIYSTQWAKQQIH